MRRCAGPAQTGFHGPLKHAKHRGPNADVAELVDARDLKSLDGNVVWVRVPPPAPSFAREASEGCPAEACGGGGLCGGALRLGKPRPAGLRVAQPRRSPVGRSVSGVAKAKRG